MLFRSGGIINANVEAFDGGTIAPGSSPGTLIINGNLVIDTGVLQLETENGVADKIIVSGLAQIGGDATIELFFDTLTDIAIEDFFEFTDPTEELEFLAGFESGDISVFTSDTDLVGDPITVTFGQEQVEVAASFGVSNEVPEPGAIALFGFGLVGLCALRRRRKAA